MKKIIIEGDGLQARDFTFIDDTINVLIKIIENRDTYHRYLNIGTGKDASIIDIYKILKDFLESEVEHVDKRQMIKTFIADNTIMNKNLDLIL